MMLRFYSRVVSRRHRRAGFALCLLLYLASCGSAVNHPPRASASTEVLSLLEQAEEAEAKRDYNLARTLYLSAIAEANSPQSAALANREMASALAFWGEYANAESRLRESLKYGPMQVRVWHDLGLIQDHQGKGEDALLSLAKAVEIAPAEPRVRVAYAALLVKQERFSDAIEQYEELQHLKIPPRIEAATLKALRLLRDEIKRPR